MMREYLVTLSGSSYFTSHIYYMTVAANSAYEARTGHYEDEEDGELTVVGVQRITDELMDNIHHQLTTIRNQQLELPPLDSRRDDLERQAYDLRQQWDAILDSEVAWA